MNSQMYDDLSFRIRAFLREELPHHSCLWWDELVMPFLTPRNRKNGEAWGPKLFMALDLAELLRVAEKNWRIISRRHQFPSRVFGLIKNLQSARNAYAHRTCIDEASLWHGLDQISIDLLDNYIGSDSQDEAA